MIKLQSFISGKIRNLFIVLVVFSLLIETGFGLYTVISSREKDRLQLFEDFKYLLKDPINQGSFIEAYDRLSRFVGKNGISCISISINDTQMGQCNLVYDPVILNLQNHDFLNTNNVRISVWIDDSDLIWKQVWLFSIRSTYYIIAIIGISYFLRRNILRISDEIDLVKNKFEDRSESVSKNFKISELNDLSVKIQYLSNIAKISERQKAAIEIAKRVSHDIRSPLTALNFLVKSSLDISEETKQLLMQVSQRISGIADDIVLNSKNPQPDSASVKSELRDFSLAEFKIIPTLKALLSEKEVEFKDNSKVQLFLRLNNLPEDTVVLYSQKMIERILSNLINNSVEAIYDDGSIYIDVQSKEQVLLISVIDFGKGIPPEVLANFQNRQFESHGKELSQSSGFGLGLKSAFEELYKVGANLRIESKMGVGTRIIIELPYRSSI